MDDVLACKQARASERRQQPGCEERGEAGAETACAAEEKREKKVREKAGKHMHIMVSETTGEGK